VTAGEASVARLQAQNPQALTELLARAGKTPAELAVWLDERGGFAALQRYLLSHDPRPFPLTDRVFDALDALDSEDVCTD
jgi:hypothetical protein